MGLLNWFDRATSRHEMHAHDEAACEVESRAEVETDPVLQAELNEEARQLRGRAQELRERVAGAEDTNDDTDGM